MRIKGCHLALLVIGVAGVAIALPVGAAQPHRESRDAALDRCFAEARASSQVDPGGAGGENRAAVYKDCMVKAGYRP